MPTDAHVAESTPRHNQQKVSNILDTPQRQQGPGREEVLKGPASDGTIHEHTNVLRPTSASTRSHLGLRP